MEELEEFGIYYNVNIQKWLYNDNEDTYYTAELIEYSKDANILYFLFIAGISKSLNKKVVHIAFIKHVTELTKMKCCPHCKNFWLNAKNDKNMDYARKIKII